MARRKKIKIRFRDLPKPIKIRKIITWVFAALGIGCLGYFVFYVRQATDTQNSYEHLADLKGTDYRQNKQVVVHLTKEEDAPDILEEYITLYNNNKSLVGWVRIDDTLIDYPVMQSKSNEYYLDHNFDQKKDNNGSIFIDSECSIWPRSQNIIMYGHNMKSGKMFGDLKKYKNEQFAKDHP